MKKCLKCNSDMYTVRDDDGYIIGYRCEGCGNYEPI